MRARRVGAIPRLNAVSLSSLSLTLSLFFTYLVQRRQGGPVGVKHVVVVVDKGLGSDV